VVHRRRLHPGRRRGAGRRSAFPLAGYSGRVPG
jgi:hypothetical protein